MARKRLCIIGFGRMGKQAVNAFADQFQVEVISSRDISSELADSRARQSSNTTESLSAAGRFLLQLIEHLKTNSPSTYRETQLLNPFMADARKKVIKALVQFDEALNRGEFNFQAYPRDKWRD
jgi:prephenate dehydrogenase